VMLASPNRYLGSLILLPFLTCQSAIDDQRSSHRYHVPSGEFEPSDRVGSWFLDEELHRDGPDRVLSWREDHRVAADGPTVAENLHHVVPRVQERFRAH